MSVAFPAIKPTQRTFTPPAWPVTSARSQAGAVSRRKWGSKSTDATLQLEFSCTDDESGSILEAHEQAQGPTEPLDLPDIIWQGVTGRLKAFIDATSGRLEWVFADAQPPPVRSVSCGRSTVTVELRAELHL
jgi:hypothetical protein